MSSLHFLPSSAFDIRTPNSAPAAVSSRHHGPAGQRKPPSPRPRRALSLGLRGCGRALQGRVRSGIGCGRGGRKRFPGDGRAGGAGVRAMAARRRLPGPAVRVGQGRGRSLRRSGGGAGPMPVFLAKGGLIRADLLGGKMAGRSGSLWGGGGRVGAWTP